MLSLGQAEQHWGPTGCLEVGSGSIGFFVEFMPLQVLGGQRQPPVLVTSSQ